MSLIFLLLLYRYLEIHDSTYRYSLTGFNRFLFQRPSLAIYGFAKDLPKNESHLEKNLYLNSQNILTVSYTVVDKTFWLPFWSNNLFCFNASNF